MNEAPRVLFHAKNLPPGRDRGVLDIFSKSSPRSTRGPSPRAENILALDFGRSAVLMQILESRALLTKIFTLLNHIIKGFIDCLSCSRKVFIFTAIY